MRKILGVSLVVLSIILGSSVLPSGMYLGLNNLITVCLMVASAILIGIGTYILDNIK